jgi:LysM repeat protein
MTKRRLPILLAAIVLVLLTPPLTTSAAPAQAPGGPGCAESYQVRLGDTLYRIAVNHGTTVPYLQALNGLPNPNVIFAGQILCVRAGGPSLPSGRPPCPPASPGCPTPSPVPCPSATPGCPTSPAQTPCPLPTLPCNVTPIPPTATPCPPSTPVCSTPQPPCTAPGCQPPAPPPPTSGSWYTVQPGDTLYSIGRRFDWSASYLASVNHLPNPNVIYIGQHLWIPSH